MTMRIDLTGRTVLITGAAGGLGRAVACGVVAAGGDVVLSDLPGAQLEQTLTDLKERGASVHAVAADLADYEQAHTLSDRVLAVTGQLDGLVSCAGIMQTKPMANITEADWDRVLGVNLSGVFHVTQSVANHLQHAGGGAVVTVASVAARSGRPDAAHYAASKAALLSLTKSAALAYAPAVRFNAVCPGIFLTSMWEAIMADRDREFGPGAGQLYLQEVLSKVPLQRVGTLVELAQVIAFLLSDLAGYVTGQALNVDGGLEMN